MHPLSVPRGSSACAIMYRCDPIDISMVCHPLVGAMRNCTRTIELGDELKVVQDSALYSQRISITCATASLQKCSMYPLTVKRGISLCTWVRTPEQKVCVEDLDYASTVHFGVYVALQQASCVVSPWHATCSRKDV